MSVKFPNISKAAANAYKKTGSFVNKAGNFLDPDGRAISSGVLTGVMLACVAPPRFLKARNNTERREVLIRDVPTVLTLLFAKKALQGAIAKSAEKKSGVILTQTPDDFKDLSIGKKLKAYFAPNSGIFVYNTDQIMQKYSSIKDSKTLSKMLESVDQHGGDIKKLLTLDANNKKASKTLAGATKDMFGDTFESMKADEIIKAVNLPKNAEKVKGIIDILDDTSLNPIIKKCKTVTSSIKTVSWVVVVGILGYGLGKLNQVITKSINAKHAQEHACPPPHAKHKIH